MQDKMRRYKAGAFQALGHPTRIALVECLMKGELSVGQLCERVGVEQANASQHLAVLRHKLLVQTRKAGNQNFYRLSDPLIGRAMEAMRDFFLTHLSEAIDVLREEQASTLDDAAIARGEAVQ